MHLSVCVCVCVCVCVLMGKATHNTKLMDLFSLTKGKWPYYQYNGTVSHQYTSSLETGWKCFLLCLIIAPHSQGRTPSAATTPTWCITIETSQEVVIRDVAPRDAPSFSKTQNTEPVGCWRFSIEGNYNKMLNNFTKKKEKKKILRLRVFQLSVTAWNNISPFPCSGIQLHDKGTCSCVVMERGILAARG